MTVRAKLGRLRKRSTASSGMRMFSLFVSETCGASTCVGVFIRRPQAVQHTAPSSSYSQQPVIAPCQPAELSNGLLNPPDNNKFHSARTDHAGGGPIWDEVQFSSAGKRWQKLQPLYLLAHYGRGSRQMAVRSVSSILPFRPFQTPAFSYPHLDPCARDDTAQMGWWNTRHRRL